MGDVDVEHVVQVAFSGDEDPSVHSRRMEPIQRSAKAFIRGACGVVSTISMPMEVKTASKAAPNFVAVANQVPESVPGLLQITGNTAAN